WMVRPPASRCGARSSHPASSCETACCRLPPEQRGTGGSHLIQMRLAEEGVAVVVTRDWRSPSWFDRLTMRGTELTMRGRSSPPARWSSPWEGTLGCRGSLHPELVEGSDPCPFRRREMLCCYLPGRPVLRGRRLRAFCSTGSS